MTFGETKSLRLRLIKESCAIETTLDGEGVLLTGVSDTSIEKKESNWGGVKEIPKAPHNTQPPKALQNIQPPKVSQNIQHPRSFFRKKNNMIFII